MLPEIKAIDFNGSVLSDDDISDRLKQLRNIVLENEDLRTNFRTDDTFLSRFLNSSEFNVDVAYQRIDKYYNFLQQYSDWFKFGDWERTEDILYRNVRCMLPGRDRQGRSIYLCKMGNIDTSKMTIRDIVHLDFYWLEYHIDDVLTQRNGTNIIIDVAGYSWKMMQWITPGNIKVALKVIENITAKEVIIHVINTNLLLDASVRIVWPFLSQKFKENVKFHCKNLSSLHEYISPDVLPREYGGTYDIDYKNEITKLIKKIDEIHENVKPIKFIVASK